MLPKIINNGYKFKAKIYSFLSTLELVILPQYSWKTRRMADKKDHASTQEGTLSDNELGTTELLSGELATIKIPGIDSVFEEQVSDREPTPLLY